uniref:TraG_N domain-containing protein n=1 Tax=Steinernema glaseri TaxID=37863 RepID=A0A1I7ZAI4_9BILA
MRPLFNGFWDVVSGAKETQPLVSALGHFVGWLPMTQWLVTIRVMGRCFEDEKSTISAVISWSYVTFG